MLVCYHLQEHAWKWKESGLKISKQNWVVWHLRFQQWLAVRKSLKYGLHIQGKESTKTEEMCKEEQQARLAAFKCLIIVCQNHYSVWVKNKQHMKKVEYWMKLQCLVYAEQERVQNLTERTDRYKKILDIYVRIWK